MLLSEVSFASLLTYSPRGDDPERRASRTWTYRLKDEERVGVAGQEASAFFVDRLAHHVSSGTLTGWFGSDVVLVPMPNHAPRMADSLWVPERLCARMVARGLGAKTITMLDRLHAVEKSRTLVRPSAGDHFRSLRVLDADTSPQRILVVDDVITRGSVGLAALSRLRAQFAHSEIRLFAMIRTMTDPSAFRAMLDPCTGSVVLQTDGSTVRTP